MISQSIENPSPVTEESQKISGYEAPAIESVLTSESLEREVHYAGDGPISGKIGN
ncbi:hypothetical protein IAD21_02283 [Abditibacteriota bacterium]|nr:hypothetical protein IAD21_02283 [Abditibacteriota bacterium]